MDHPLRPCDSRPKGAWMRKMGWVAAAIGFATAGGVVLAVFSELFEGSWLSGRRQHLAHTLPDGDTGVVGAVRAGGVGVSRTMHGAQEQQWKERRGNDTLGDGLVKHYSSFTEYALESSTNTSNGLPLPVPVVQPIGQESALSIPVITIIGVQKGGTTNLRGNLLMHPMVWGVWVEVHFFDRGPSGFPEVAQWEGDGLDQDIGFEATGEILTEYAEACVIKGRAFSQRHSGLFRGDGLLVDSSPRYIFNPATPYRIKMVRPDAKFVLVLRDPTDRYFSQLRMEMCRTKDPEDAMLKFNPIHKFHPPGGAQMYLTAADEGYEPYTAICRGENASSSDLWECSEALEVYHPLYRGLYADQLERWFRVFDRSQIMIIDSSEMFEDFIGVVTAVAEFAGLPEHSFEYDSSHEFKGVDCQEHERTQRNGYFGDGGRYETMIEEEELFREWYRPHNERLYELLGREPMWR